jgi:DHA2 family multidrug resistance protein
VQILNQPGVGPQSAVSAFSAAGMPAVQAVRQYENLLQSQSVMLATNQIFLVIGVVLVAAAASVWIAPRPSRMVRPGAGGH